MAGPSPRPFKTSEIKSRILNVATPTIFMVKLAPPQPIQNLLKDRGLLWSTIGEDVELRCHRVTTPASSFLTHSVSSDYMGVAEEIPYRRGYENELAMSFYVDNNYETVHFFETWMDYMSGRDYSNPTQTDLSPTQFYRVNYPDGSTGNNGYRTNIYLTKFEKDISTSERIENTRQKKRSLEYTFIDAYPKSINSMELGYGMSDEVLTLDMTFGYTRYVLNRDLIGREPGPLLGDPTLGANDNPANITSTSPFA